ncbi:MAG: hypothetical protein WCL06_15850, partial [Bacteroidota bacterium]
KQKIQTNSNDVPNPKSTELIFYPKADGYYYKNSEGVEFTIGGTSIPSGRTQHENTRLEVLDMISKKVLIPGDIYFITDKNVIATSLSEDLLDSSGYYVSKGDKCSQGVLIVDSVGYGSTLSSISIDAIELLEKSITFTGNDAVLAAKDISSAIKDNLGHSNYTAYAKGNIVIIKAIDSGIKKNGKMIMVGGQDGISISVPDTMKGGSENVIMIMPCKYQINDEVTSDNATIPGYISEIFDTKHWVKVTADINAFVGNQQYDITMFDFGNSMIFNCEFHNCSFYSEYDGIMKSKISDCKFIGCSFMNSLILQSSITTSEFFDVQFAGVFNNVNFNNSKFIRTQFHKTIVNLKLTYDDNPVSGSVCAEVDLQGKTETVVGFLPYECFVYMAVASFGSVDEAPEFKIGTSDQDDCIMTAMAGSELLNTRIVLIDGMTYKPSSEDCIPIIIKSDIAQSVKAVCSFKFNFSK